MLFERRVVKGYERSAPKNSEQDSQMQLSYRKFHSWKSWATYRWCPSSICGWASLAARHHRTWQSGAGESFSGDRAQGGVVWCEGSVERERNQAESHIGVPCKGKTPSRVNHWAHEHLGSMLLIVGTPLVAMEWSQQDGYERLSTQRMDRNWNPINV